MAAALRGQASSRFHQSFSALSRVQQQQQRWASSTKIIAVAQHQMLRANNDKLLKRIEKTWKTTLVPYSYEGGAAEPFYRFRIKGTTNSVYHTKGFLNCLEDPAFDPHAALDDPQRLASLQTPSPSKDTASIAASDAASDPGAATTNPGALEFVYFRMPSEALERLQQKHPEILPRLQAIYNTRIHFNPADPENLSLSDQPDKILLRVDGPERRAVVRTKSFLNNLINPTFEAQHALQNAIEEQDLNLFTLSVHMSRAKFNMLKANNGELLSQIEKVYNVKTRNQHITRRPAVFVIGLREDTNRARAFIDSIDAGLNNASKDAVPPADIKDAYRTTMRAAASNVVVLTTQLASSHPSSHDKTQFATLRGMTLSSMTSVTLDPEPVVSFSIRRPSRTFDFISQGQTFYVNFLRSNDQGALIANTFAQPYHDPSEPFRLIRDRQLADVSSDGHHEPNLQSEAISAHFRCQTMPDKFVDIGDHTVVFARVTNIFTPATEGEKIKNQKSSFLAYVHGNYRQLGGRRLGLNPPAIVEQQTMDQKQSAVLTSPQEDDSWLDESDEVLATHSQEPEVESQKDDTQHSNAPTAEEVAERRRLETFSEDYFRMAEGEDDILEERAADQRALGEAQKPETPKP